MRRYSGFLSLLPLLLAAWLYLPAVRLPFFWDDVIHFRYVSSVSSWQILTDAERVGYYRPLVNLILQIPFKLGGFPDASLWHLLLVWNHLINAALIGALARHLRMSESARFVAMLMFAIFPLHFQAVVWVLAWFHPLVVSLILLTCIAGLRYWHDSRRRGMLVLAWLAGMTAPFIHENGVLAAVFLGLVILYSEPGAGSHKSQTDFRIRFWLPADIFTGGLSPLSMRLVILLLPLLLAALVYSLILLRMRILGSDEPRTLADMQFNVAYFLQGFSFPFQLIGIQSVWVGIMPMLLLAGIFLRRTWLGVVWFLLASLPAVLLLTEIYVTNAPRLLYLGAVGIAFTIALLPRPIAGIAAVLGLILSIGFVRGRIDLHLALGAGYTELDSLLAEAGGGDAPGAIDSLVINPPMWLDAEDRAFPLGKMGAIFIPDYYGLRDFVWLNTGIDYDVLETGYFYDAVDGWDGYVSGLKGVHIVDRGTMHGYIQNHDWIYAFHVVDESRFTARLIGVRGVPVPHYEADFADSLRLGFVRIQRQENGFMRVALHWEKLMDGWLTYIPFVHLVCNGVIIDQADGAPLDKLYDLDVWAQGETWVDYRYLRETSEACGVVRVGLYDPISGERASITTSNGESYAGDFLQFPVVQ